MKLDDVNKFNNIDLSMCKTNEEKINKLLKINSYYFYSLFVLLCPQDQEIYFTYLNPYYLKIYLQEKSDEFISNFIISNYSTIDKLYFSDYINLINDINLKYHVIIFLIKKMPVFFIMPAIENINNELLKIKIIKYLFSEQIDGWYFIEAIKTLNNDKHKETFIPKLSTDLQVEIIKSFKDKNLIKEYSHKKDYDYYRPILTVATEDKNFIKEQFIKSDSPKFQHNLIETICDNKFKIELINLITDCERKYFLLSNNQENYNNYLKESNIKPLLNSNIDKNITIGVELECCHKDINKFAGINKILECFTIVPDGSVKSGFEIVSPVLHYNIDDLQQLKYICELLENCNFYTDYSCGGHIHIGAKHLESIEDINMLLYLYTNCEHIIYNICNKEYSQPRNSIQKYAKTIKNNFLNIVENNTLEEQTFQNLILSLKKINGSRYTGLNFSNLYNKGKNTFEFRMPNGEINFKELLYNIKLFAKLIEKSHELTHINNNNYKFIQAKLLSQAMPEKNRLEILLNILFDTEEERKPYRQRYNANINLFKITEDEYKEQFIELDDNSKKLVIKK